MCDASNGGCASDLLEQIPPGITQPVSGPRKTRSLRCPGTAYLTFERIENDFLCLHGAPGLDQIGNDLTLALCERDADTAQRIEPLDRIFQCFAKLHRRRAQILSKHGGEILGKAKGAREGLAGNRAEGCKHRGCIHHRLGRSHRRAFDLLGEASKIACGETRGIASRLEDGFEAAVRGLGFARRIKARFETEGNGTQGRPGNQTDWAQSRECGTDRANLRCGRFH